MTNRPYYAVAENSVQIDKDEYIAMQLKIKICRCIDDISLPTLNKIDELLKEEFKFDKKTR